MIIIISKFGLGDIGLCSKWPKLQIRLERAEIGLSDKRSDKSRKLGRRLESGTVVNKFIFSTRGFGHKKKRCPCKRRRSTNSAQHGARFTQANIFSRVDRRLRFAFCVFSSKRIRFYVVSCSPSSPLSLTLPRRCPGTEGPNTWGGGGNVILVLNGWLPPSPSRLLLPPALPGRRGSWVPGSLHKRGGGALVARSSPRLEVSCLCDGVARRRPPAFHTTARELQTYTFECPGASNNTKIPREDLSGRGDRIEIVAGDACPFCNSAKTRPERSRVSGLRAKKFGDLIFLDHGSAKIWRQNLRIPDYFGWSHVTFDSPSTPKYFHIAGDC